MIAARTLRRVIAGGLVLAVGGGFAALAAQPSAAPSARAAVTLAAATTSATVAAGSPTIKPAAGDPRTRVARKRYAAEARGAAARKTLRRVAADPALVRLLASGNDAAVRSYVNRHFRQVWYHWHVSRMRITRGSHVVAEVGVPFVVTGPEQVLRDRSGRAVGTLQVSVQDEIGYVRFMKRNHAVDVVVRGRGAAHVRSSLPASAGVALPARGPVTIAGRRYQVSSFAETAWNAEPITVFVLRAG